MIASTPYTYSIVSVPRDRADYAPYGGAEDLFYATDSEVILSGPAETGKTLAACWKVHTLATKYPNCNGAIVRKTQASIYGSVLLTYKRVIAGSPVKPYGGEKPEKYVYPNGSVIWVGGLDNPDRILSSERDFIYVNQSEELTVDDWEKLSTRTTGRGSVIRYPQLFGDCNPSGRLHWIRQRAAAGKLRFIESKHEDNPTLFDPRTGAITEQGRKTMQTLDALTGVRRLRLRDGIWATAEGAVYDQFNASFHVRNRPITDFVYYAMGVDEGYTNPAVILLIGIDPDGRVHVIREFYRRGVLQDDVVHVILDWFDEVRGWGLDQHMTTGQDEASFNPDAYPKIDFIAVDASAAGLIADLVSHGLPAVGARGRVIDGIHNVQDMLKVNGDGRPRLTVAPECIETINEFESYLWKPDRDEPVKELDHAMDALRYPLGFLARSAVVTTENPFYDY